MLVTGDGPRATFHRLARVHLGRRATKLATSKLATRFDGIIMKLTHIFLLGCAALLFFAFGPYPPLDHAGTFWVIFLPFFAVLAVVLRRAGADKRASRRYVFAAMLPWVIALLFLGNGVLDYSEERQYQTVVVETRYSYRSGIFDTILVRSWRPGRKTESVRVRSYQRFFYPGDQVTVGIKSGALGLSWIKSVSR